MAVEMSTGHQPDVRLRQVPPLPEMGSWDPGGGNPGSPSSGISNGRDFGQVILSGGRPSTRCRRGELQVRRMERWQKIGYRTQRWKGAGLPYKSYAIKQSPSSPLAFSAARVAFSSSLSNPFLARSSIAFKRLRRSAFIRLSCGMWNVNTEKCQDDTKKAVVVIAIQLGLG